MTSGDALWYKDAIIYETHVRAYYDSNGDGVGDFSGLTQKLDYLKDLGINCIWLLPFYPSPLRDDGYDISDYRGINPVYGNMRDFRTFIRQAHQRGIRVITELVVNHTSDQHRWFQSARKASPDTVRRNYYVWSDTDQKYRDARIIFTDTEVSNWTWDPLAKAYYWHRFFHHQPDLNFDNPAVLRSLIKALRFWLDQGVDGFRLDAVPYLIEREGTNCENLVETHAVLKEIRKHVDQYYTDRMLLAEANQWPDDVSPYFADGDECHMAFHFPLMPRIFMALRQEDRHPITDILRGTPDIPENCQWALFLRNHDELTLEMVTDEERDYMYRSYAADPRMRINIGIRRRLAPLMDNSRRRMELLNSLLFSLKGTPIIYYGDEIGMGDNIYLGDRNGVRTPMQWSGDRNAGFSHTDFAKLYAAPIMDPVYGFQSINVEAQERDPSSLLNWMKRMIALRNQFKVFGRGKIDLILPKNRKVFVYTRSDDENTILCVANLSRFVQPVELNLSRYAGLTPVEMLGHAEFPRIQESPYFLTLAPHSFYWFLLQRVLETLRIRVSPTTEEEVDRLPVLEIVGAWETLQNKTIPDEPGKNILPRFIQRQRWFGAKTKGIESVRILDRIFLDTARPVAWLTLAETHLTDTERQLYSVPLSVIPHTNAWINREKTVAQLRSNTEEGYMVDGMADNSVCQTLLEIIRDQQIVQGQRGVLQAIRTSASSDYFGGLRKPIKIRRDFGEQSNSSVLFGDRLVLKLFRRLQPGPNPDFEILRYLTERSNFTRIPKLVGAIEYRQQNAEPTTIAILEAYIPNQGDAWTHTLDELSRYYERASSFREGIEQIQEHRGPFCELLSREIPPLIREMVGASMEEAAVLGKCTAELHLALANEETLPEFTPHLLSAEDFNALSDEWIGHAEKVLSNLDQASGQISESQKSYLHNVISARERILKAFTSLRNDPFELYKIRIHGDYHLGQLLWVKNDFVILDFEGEPARPLTERRKKQPALKDVAGMIRSFGYAAYAGLFQFTTHRPAEFAPLELWAEIWQTWTSVAFLKSYLSTAAGARFLPAAPMQIQKLLVCLLLDKALYELSYELNNRPEWVRIPLAGIQNLIHVI